MKKRILIVEDDASFCMMLRSWFERNDFEVVSCTKTSEAKKAILKNNFDIILTDLRLPDDDGIMLLAWIKENNLTAPVIIMTSYAEIQSAVSAMKLGAFDFLEKPINPSILKEKIEQALNSTETKSQSDKNKSVKKNKLETTDFVTGKSTEARKMYEYIRLVAPTQMSVLILGESGTGKEYAARLIHENSQRNSAPFIAVDCGSLSKELAPSELFGHLKGSFTSAISDKKGIFEQADGGTVFLDEVGNLPYEVQVQLLRALQEKKIRPVGSASDIHVDVRILSATNEDLEKAIAKGSFREDLYHRLNEFSITTPPLRERIEDLPAFTNYFLELANNELGKQINRISKEALHILQKQYWGGNLRELKNVIRRAALFAQTDEILPENLPVFPSAVEEKKEMSLTLNPEKEKELIEEAIKKANGNKTVAAKLLKIDRKTLYNKMHQYNMNL